MGDLNFRLDTLTKEEVELKIKEGDIKSLWPYDQVSGCLPIPYALFYPFFTQQVWNATSSDQLSSLIVTCSE
jgi:hypothetical protein